MLPLTSTARTSTVAPGASATGPEYRVHDPPGNRYSTPATPRSDSPFVPGCPGDPDIRTGQSPDARRRAEVVHDAVLAQRPPRNADPPPVPDEQVRKPRPVLAWDELHEIALDLDGILLLRQPEPLREPAHVRVDDDPLRVSAFGGHDV